MAIATKLREMAGGVVNALSGDDLREIATKFVLQARQLESFMKFYGEANGQRNHAEYQVDLLIDAIKQAALKAGIIHDQAMPDDQPDLNGPLAIMLCEDMGEMIAEEKPLRRVKHTMRGSTYGVLGEAEAQISKRLLAGVLSEGKSRLLMEGDKLVVYKSEADGKLWVRFPDEFDDGRFVDVD